MIIAKFEGCNSELTRSDNGQKASCFTDMKGITTICLQLDEIEIKELAATGRFYATIFPVGTVLPKINFTVTKPLIADTNQNLN